MPSNNSLRTAVLAIASLALVVGLYAIYQYTESSKRPPVPLAEATPSPTPASTPGAIPIAAATPAPDNGEPAAAIPVGTERVPLGPGDQFNVHIYNDDDGRIRAQITGSQWRPLGDDGNEGEVLDLVIRLNTQSGQAVRIEGDRGFIKLGSSDLQNLNPRSGKIVGNVRITVDRRSEEERTLDTSDDAGEIAEEHLVVLRMQELSFDVEYARVETSKPFTLTANEMFIAGAGLSVRYNELDSRIEELTIPPGENRIEVLAESGNFAMGADAETSAPPVDETPNPPSPAPVADDRANGVPLLAVDEDKRGSKPRPIDTYTARFASNVEIRQYAGDKQIGELLADVLSVAFDFGQKQRDAADRGAAPEQPARAKDPSAAGADVPSAAQERIVLTWDGDLQVTSKRQGEHTKGQIGQRVHVSASGQPVRVTSRDRRIVCGAFHYEDDTEFARVIGYDDIPARVFAAEFGEIEGHEILLDPKAQRAIAKGPGGRLIRRASAADAQDASNQTGDIEVRFEDELIASFDDVTVQKRDESGNLREQSKQVLAAASITGNVDMNHGGERIQCARVDIGFDTDPAGTTYPTTAKAYGNVIASQADRFIAARDRMLVDFARIEKAKPPFDMVRARQEAASRGMDPDKVDWVRVRAHYAKPEYREGIKRLQAYGDVEVRDPEQSVEINCDALDCRFADGERIESGLVTPAADGNAYVGLGEFSIASSEPIPFDVAAQTADVDGPGRMTFLTKQDIDGGRRNEPIPVSVQWSGRMAFDGMKNEAVFVDGVEVETETSQYRCDNLRVDFVDAVPKEEAAGEGDKWWLLTPLVSSSEKADQPANRLRVQGSSIDKDPVFIYATGNVVARHRRMDPQTRRLRSRARIGGPVMAIDLREEYVTIQGAGTLLIEDYRLRTDKGKQTASSRPRTSPFGRAMRDDPSQTYMAWEESMTYRYGTNIADFQKDISIAHRTGDKMIGAEKIFGDQLDDQTLRRGQEATLTCQSLVVEFLRTEEDGVNSMSGYDVAAFNASGQVHFTDADISALATQVTFERGDNGLQILGAPGQPAQIFDQRKRFSEMRGPRFIWDRTTNRIMAPRSTVHSN